MLLLFLNKQGFTSRIALLNQYYLFNDRGRTVPRLQIEKVFIHLLGGSGSKTSRI